MLADHLPCTYRSFVPLTISIALCGSGSLVATLTLQFIKIISPLCTSWLSATTWHLLFHDLIIPTVIRAPSFVAAFPTISPGLQKTATTEFLNDASVPVNSDVFLIALVNGGTSRLSCLTQYIHFSPHTSLRFVISSSACLLGCSVILHLAGPSVVAQPFSKLPRTTLAVYQHCLLRSLPDC